MAEDDDILTVKQRTVSATSGGNKPTGVPASVFEAGKLAKPAKRGRSAPLPLLELDKVEIRKAVPLPPPKTQSRESVYRALLDRMQAGDSVVLSTPHAKSVVSCAKKHGIKVATRQLDDETTGLWRQ